MIIICCLISAYLGFTVAKGLDNNHRELFQAYMDEQLKLSKEKSYYEQCYRLLLTSIRVNNIYQRILKEDTLITKGEIPDDGRPKLTDNDIKKINEKITVLTEQRDELLLKEKDYSEVIY